MGVSGLRCDQCEMPTVSGAVLTRIELALVFFLLRLRRGFVGGEVRFLREWLGLTQSELARRLAINRVTLANWESGRRPVSRRGSYMLKSQVTGRVLGRGLLPAREERKLAAEALDSAPSEASPRSAQPYVLAADALNEPS